MKVAYIVFPGIYAVGCFILGESGLTFITWQFWAILACFFSMHISAAFIYSRKKGGE